MLDLYGTEYNDIFVMLSHGGIVFQNFSPIINNMIKFKISSKSVQVKSFFYIFIYFILITDAAKNLIYVFYT